MIHTNTTEPRQPLDLADLRERLETYRRLALHVARMKPYEDDSRGAFRNAALHLAKALGTDSLTDPASGLLALLDRLEAAERSLARVRELRDAWDAHKEWERVAGMRMMGVGR